MLGTELRRATFQGPVHAYVAVPGGKTSYLSELRAGKEVVVIDQNGMQRTAIVGRVKIETRPLILVEAKVCVLSLVLQQIVYYSIRSMAASSRKRFLSGSCIYFSFQVASFL